MSTMCEPSSATFRWFGSRRILFWTWPWLRTPTLQLRHAETRDPKDSPIKTCWVFRCLLWRGRKTPTHIWRVRTSPRKLGSHHAFRPCVNHPVPPFDSLGAVESFAGPDRGSLSQKNWPYHGMPKPSTYHIIVYLLLNSILKHIAGLWCLSIQGK